MSTTLNGKRPLAAARMDADAFRRFFDGCYECWEFAGSVRRRRNEVGDVEHVVIPRVVARAPATAAACARSSG